VKPMHVLPHIAGTIFFFLVVIAPIEVLAEGAHILIYTEVDDVQYVLIADHKHPTQVQRGWSILGGTIEDNETSLDAAIREVIEESNGAFDKAILLRTVNKDINVQTNDNTLFFAGTKFQPANIYSYRVSTIHGGARGERGPFAWVPWTLITDAAIEADQLGNDCANSPVMIPPEYLPDNRQTSWFGCWFLEHVLLTEKNGGLPESSR